jgi:hypothetical protein
MRGRDRFVFISKQLTRGPGGPREMTMPADVTIDEVEELLAGAYDDRIYTVENDVVWVSGMNQQCTYVARRMAKHLTANDIPTSLVYDDGAVRFGGVQFNWGEDA